MTITDKGTGRTYESLGYFEDGGDAGDTYDYSYPQEDKVITSLGRKAEITLEEAGPLMARFRVELKLPLPKGLTGDRRARSEELVEQPIISWVELTAGSPRVDIQTVVYNLAKDHRLRVLFPTALKVDRSWAEEPFDVAEFPIVPEPPLEEIPERLEGLVIAGRNRVPSATRPFQNFFTVTDGKAGLAVLSDGLAEYELLEDGTLALTLLRCVGWLARDDLLTREGDIGPQILTPEAQLLGKHAFRYSIYPYMGDWLRGRVHLQAEAHNLKLRGVWSSYHSGSLPDRMSFLSVESEPSDALKLTAVKRAEEGEELVLRLYNVTDRAVRGRIRFQVRVQAGSGSESEVEVERACRTDLNEEEGEELALSDEGALEVEARAKEIVTLKVRIKMRMRCRRRGPSPLIEPEGPAYLAESPRLEAPLGSGVEAKLPPPITEEDPQSEEERARALEATVQGLERAIQEIETERSGAGGLELELEELARLQRLRGELATAKRKWLEARLSALLARKRLIELNRSQAQGQEGEELARIEREIGEMGEEMCRVRIEKRVGEYLSSYYEGLLREHGNGKGRGKGREGKG